ncbi:Fe-S oxidoreductase [Pontibacillus halophilus JSM 076056 = DSM 19796]|uniref:Lactate utilization protein A n=1 Tax=Pontibacillus halophilus JSM 076056 = DSM 19796 TaxID=1385510 RepID=A0A0A5G6B3_9BACI|nr:(Fe-S)-binding protein [Pontibacillus halophilus]KGX88661.1 Fe-S oxidoreductase [Pontibacillus halophilus JSM 076056 = DSM 19796]
MKVSIFITCLCDTFTPDVGKDTVQLLERFGCEVDFPAGQTCCGQPAYNSGYKREAVKGMKQMIEAFEPSEYVVGPSGSCVHMIKDYPRVLSEEPEWRDRAQKLADKTYELTQFLVDVLKVQDVGSTFKGKATYHPSCHMTRLLGVKDAPRILLENVKGLELIELPSGEDCCGFGGTFAVKNSAISGQMVQEKAAHIEETKADYLIGGDMGCLMNMGGSMRRNGQEVEVLHIAQVLNS